MLRPSSPRGRGGGGQAFARLCALPSLAAVAELTELSELAELADISGLSAIAGITGLAGLSELAGLSGLVGLAGFAVRAGLSPLFALDALTKLSALAEPAAELRAWDVRKPLVQPPRQGPADSKNPRCRQHTPIQNGKQLATAAKIPIWENATARAGKR